MSDVKNISKENILKLIEISYKNGFQNGLKSVERIKLDDGNLKSIAIKIYDSVIKEEKKED